MELASYQQVPAAAIALDLEKAYDGLPLKHLKALMLRAGVPPQLAVARQACHLSGGSMAWVHRALAALRFWR